MPHPRLGEGVAAFVIPVPGEAVDLAALSAFVGASGLANQKRPEKIFFVDSLPRTASGKVRKDLLRAEAKRLVEGV
jgi:acyl-CoA synthetase (AMP-forming)/AMP-acid ligase II